MRIIRKIALVALILSFGILAACEQDHDVCLHDWSEWEKVSDPACTQAGVEKRTCRINPSHAETRAIEAFGHDWGDWIVTTPTSDTEDGVETRICKHNSAHIQTRNLGDEEPIEQPVGNNEQVGRNEYGYFVTKSGLWLSKDGEEYTVIAYSGKSKTVEIPAYVNDLPITVIGDGAYLSLEVEWYTPPVWTKYMFSKNTEITSVTFEEGSKMRHIGWVAFSGCTSLVQFETPESLESIGEGAFKNTGLWNKTPNNSVVYVGSWAVGYKGSGTEDVAIKPGTVGISSCAFLNAPFRNITIPDSVKTIGNLAFQGSQLVHSAPNNGVVYADKWAVAHKGTLGDITLKPGTVGIADAALQYGYTLTSIVIPSTVKTIGKDAFLLCKDLTTVTMEEGLISIGNSAFLYCSSLYKIEIPQSVKSIGSSVFGDCRALTSVILPEGIETISYGLFSGCNSLRKVAIPSSVKVIANRAFASTAIRDIVIPKGVISIGANAFVNSSRMETFVVEEGNQFYSSEGNCLIEIATNKLLAGFKNTQIPEGVKHIGDAAFQQTNITFIVIPDSVLTIGDYAFGFCTELEFVFFGSGITEIGEYAFSSSGIKTLELPQNLSRIEAFAFNECSIESLVIPDSVTYLGMGAFYKTTITSIDFGDADFEIGGWGVFAYCASLVSVEIPSSMKIIGHLMFWNCTSLTDVVIESGVTTIESSAFSGCSKLTSIVIPDTVVTMKSVFYGCTQLTIYAEAKEKPSGWSSDWNSGNRPVVWNYKNS